MTVTTTNRRFDISWFLLLVLFSLLVATSAFQPVLLMGNNKASSSIGQIYFRGSTKQKHRQPSNLFLARIGGSAQKQDDDELLVNSSTSDDDVADYQIKLREAEKAMAAAEEARKKLLLKNSSLKTNRSKPLPPPNSLSRIEYSDAGTMFIEIPPKGLGTDSFFTGAFSLAWFSAIIPATFASGGASLLFMLPFWAAGGMVAKNAVFDLFVSGMLQVGKFAWSVENNYARKSINKKEGPTEQLRGATAEIVAVVNGVPQGEIKLYTDKGMTAFGLGLSIEELEYIAGEINDHLSQIRETQDSE